MASAEVEQTAAAEVPEKVPEAAAPETAAEAETKTPVGPSLSQSPKAWLSSLSGPALRKLAFVVLEWVHGQAGLEGEVPGAATKEVTPAQFVGHLKDGQALGKLANQMQPGAVELAEAKEGEELSPEQRKTNLQAFQTFAKDKVEVGDADLLNVDKVEKGKGFKGLLSTLMALATKASEKFSKEGLSVDSLMAMGVAAFGKNWLNNLLARVFRRGSNSSVKAGAKEEANGAKGNGAPAKDPAPKDDIPHADDAPGPDAADAAPAKAAE